MTSDHRAVPNLVLNLYLYPVGAWAIALALLYFTGRGALAIPLCYPLALWQIGLSAWWGRSLLAGLDAEALTTAEAHAGVRSVGQILAWSALCPALVFMTNDPLAPSAWSAALGAVTISVLAYLGVMGLTRLASRWTHAAAIAIACVALPLNATGAVTMASMLGLFDAVLSVTPLSDERVPREDGAGAPSPGGARSESDRDP